MREHDVIVSLLREILALDLSGGGLTPEEKQQIQEALKRKVSTINGNGPDANGNVNVNTGTDEEWALVRKAVSLESDILKFNDVGLSVVNGKTCQTYTTTD